MTRFTMFTKVCGDYEITSDGRTVWFNGPRGCLGRFTHTCLETPLGAHVGPMGLEEWKTFTQFFLNAYGIEIDDHLMPRFLQEIAA